MTARRAKDFRFVIGKQYRLRRDQRIFPSARNEDRLLCLHALAYRNLFSFREQRRNRRRSLLRKQFSCRSDPRILQKTLYEDLVLEHVGNAENTHSQMMRHIAFQHRISSPDTASVEIERFVKAVFSVHLEALQLLQIPQDLLRIAFQHEKACVRRHDPSRFHDGIQCQTRNAERTVLIIHRTVKSKITAFRNTEHRMPSAEEISLDRGSALHTVCV